MLGDHELVSSTDARVWAEHFVATVREHPEIPINEDSMTTWFAAAIEAGRSLK